MVPSPTTCTARTITRPAVFGNSVRRIGLIRSDGTHLELAPDDELFAATIGGLGLTGIIAWVEVQLARIGSAYIRVERIPFQTIADFFTLAEDANDFEHTVAWIDCASSGSSLGRGIFQRADWSSQGGLAAHDERSRLTVPIEAPNALLNRQTVRLFNALYYRLQKAGERHPDRSLRQLLLSA